MSKYIDRAALFNSLSGAKTVEEIFAAIQAAPAADVQEIRRGKWEWNNKDECFYSCSVCGHKAYGNTGEIVSGFYNYCPRCGAALIEEEEA